MDQMGVGLFMDVDSTLTAGLIQQHFASLLGVEQQYISIERDYQGNRITPAEFGERLIQLFNGAGFSREFCDLHWESLKIAPYTDDLLGLPVTKYLVSSGPSYFVSRFAVKYRIPPQNVLCSKYEFSSDGKLASCKAVSDTQKHNFFVERSARHTLTIGVGDDAKFDGPFVEDCDVPIYTSRTHGALYAESIETVMNLVTRLSRFQGSVPRSTPKLFIGSSTAQRSIAVSLHGQLEQSCDPTVWKDGIFEPSKTNIESLEKSLPQFDFAAFVMAPEDFVVTAQGASKPAVRDNVIFELGMFIGRLGRERCFMLHPREAPPSLPTDLSGVVLLEYPGDRARTEPDAAITACAQKIQRRIVEMGCRGLRL